MGFLKNIFGKKEKETDIMKFVADNKKRVESSVNYQLCFVSLKALFFNEKVKIGEIYGNEELAKNLYLTALLMLKEIKKMKIPDEFTRMPVHFIEGKTYKGIVIEVPNAKYECECNFVGLIESDDGRKTYYTNEYYSGEKQFGLCMTTDKMRISLKARPQTLEEFKNSI